MYRDKFKLDKNRAKVTINWWRQVEYLNSTVYGRSRNSKWKAGEPINVCSYRFLTLPPIEFLQAFPPSFNSLSSVIVDSFSSNGNLLPPFFPHALD